MFKANPEDCLCCGVCVESCKERAISLGDNSAYIDQELCVECGNCHEICPGDAISEG
jgi:uncharacterized Fe-S center protein